MMFAQLQVPQAQIVYVLFGLIGLIIAAGAVVNLALGLRKLFGKQPPMHEQIAKMREEFVREIATHEATVETRLKDHERDDTEEFQRLEQKIDGAVSKVDGLRQSIQDNGEIRKNTMLAHIEDVRTKLNDKIDRQTELLNKKIDSSTEAQTKLLLSMMKGQS